MKPKFLSLIHFIKASLAVKKAWNKMTASERVRICCLFREIERNIEKVNHG